MKSLHTYYLQLKRQNKGKSGDAAKKKVKWPFFESLQFMDLKNPPSTFTDSATLEKQFLSDTNADDDTDFSSAIDSSGGNLISPPPSLERRNPPKKRKTDDHSLAPLFERAVNVMEMGAKPPTPKPDAVLLNVDEKLDKLFGDTVVLKLSKIREGEDKEDLKDIIMAEIRKVQRAQNTN